MFRRKSDFFSADPILGASISIPQDSECDFLFYSPAFRSWSRPMPSRCIFLCFFAFLLVFRAGPPNPASVHGSEILSSSRYEEGRFPPPFSIRSPSPVPVLLAPGLRWQGLCKEMFTSICQEVLANCGGVTSTKSGTDLEFRPPSNV